MVPVGEGVAMGLRLLVCNRKPLRRKGEREEVLQNGVTNSSLEKMVVDLTSLVACSSFGQREFCELRLREKKKKKMRRRRMEEEQRQLVTHWELQRQAPGAWLLLAAAEGEEQKEEKEKKEKEEEEEGREGAIVRFDGSRSSRKIREGGEGDRERKAATVQIKKNETERGAGEEEGKEKGERELSVGELVDGSLGRCYSAEEEEEEEEKRERDVLLLRERKRKRKRRRGEGMGMSGAGGQLCRMQERGVAACVGKSGRRGREKEEERGRETEG